MKSKIVFPIVAVFLFGLVFTANALVITFDDLEIPVTATHSGLGFHYLSQYDFGGFNITSTQPGSTGMGYADQGSVFYRGSAGLSIGSSSSRFVMTRTDGQLFTINSFDHHFLYQEQNEFFIDAYDSSDTLITSLHLLVTAPGTTSAPWGTITFDDSFNNIAKLVWNSESTSAYDLHQVDNVDVVVSAPVPEPATFILLGSGLAGLAFYRRKRK